MPTKSDFYLLAFLRHENELFIAFLVIYGITLWFLGQGWGNVRRFVMEDETETKFSAENFFIQSIST